MISAGRVLIIPKGEYNAATAYSMLDLVSYNGSSYIAKQSTTGNLPTNPTYWQLSAYGGSAANIAGNFAQLETTDYASQNYSVGDFLVTKDSELCKVIDTITTGDELVIDTNIEVTTVEEMVADAIDHTDALDAENVKLKGLTAISVQTDLNSVTTLGNYYKSGTSFYVTNAPTGIDSDITAVFRLTVENGSDTTNKYIQTIVTNNGKLYKRGYNGSAWSDWIEYVSKAVADTKQPKTLDTPITIGGTSRTTVEAALGALQSAKADSSGLGTAAAKDSTDTLSSGSTDLIESGAVYSANQTLTNQVVKNTENIETNLGSINILKSSGNWRTGLRFKNLGTSFTSEQQTALVDGDFSEFWNGDYWVIGGHNWRIVDNSGIARRRGDTNFDSNSLVIMPDDNLVTAEAYLIDNDNASGHGYSNCAYRTRTDGKGRAQCKSIISSAFGSSHIASHRELMSSARGTGGATSWAWTDADVELPSEANIYGHPAWGAGVVTTGTYATGYNVGTEWGQFMLFRLAPYMAINRSQNYWLRDIASASYFAVVNSGGGADYGAPSVAYIGLRPHFILV